MTEKKTQRSKEIAVLGVPVDWNSSFRRGPAMAPKHIREALFSPSANLWTENGINLGDNRGWHLLPDLEFKVPKDAFPLIETEISALLQQDFRIVALGGDHSITYPIIRAYSKHHKDLNVLQFDAHPDLYDELYHNRLSHGCPFSRIMEEKLVKRLVQVGIRSMTGEHRKQAERFSVEVLSISETRQIDQISFDGPVYISLDLDCLDPAFAPGTSHQEPGGLSTRDVLSVIQNIEGIIIGADIVELNPLRDQQEVTAMVAAKFLREILGRMLSQYK